LSFDPLSFVDAKFLIGLVTGVVGAIAAKILAVYRDRLRVIDYTVTHEKIAASGSDVVFGEISVNWNGNAVSNLYTSTVAFTNECGKDISKLRVKVYTGRETRILGERSGLLDTTYALPWADDFKQQLAVPEGAKPTDAQYRKYFHDRAYDVPVLNRKQTIEFKYLVACDDSTSPPRVWIETLHEGVKFRFRNNEQMIFGAPMRIATNIGVVISMVIYFLMSVAFDSVWVVGATSLLAGLMCMFVGAWAYRLVRPLRALLEK
jgi:hypothetical protein